MFLDCPHHVDDGGAVRCGLPAEVEYRYSAASTGGMLESAKIRCPLGHWFNGPIEFLTLRRDGETAAAVVEVSASRLGATAQAAPGFAGQETV